MKQKLLENLKAVNSCTICLNNSKKQCKPDGLHWIWGLIEI